MPFPVYGGNSSRRFGVPLLMHLGRERETWHAAQNPPLPAAWSRSSAAFAPLVSSSLVPRGTSLILLAGLPATMVYSGTSCNKHQYAIPVATPQGPAQMRTYLGDYARRAYDGATPNLYSRQDRDIAADPAVLSNFNLRATFGALRAIPHLRIQRMRSGEEAHIRGEQTPRAYSDGTGVEDGAIEIDEDVLANMHIRPIVHADRRLNPRIVGEDIFVFLLCGGFLRERSLVVNDAWFSCQRLLGTLCAVFYVLTPSKARRASCGSHRRSC
jgi:hypothetical protein